MPDRLIDSMADDLGVSHIYGENHEAFERRTVFSALRYWMQAYTLDDGFGGAYGVAGKTITRKAARWLDEMTGMYPSLRFGTSPIDNGIINVMSEDMLAIGDLIKTSDGMIRCIEGHTVTFAPRMAAIVGFSDPTIRRPDSAFLSGTVMLVPSGNAPVESAGFSRPTSLSIIPRFETLDRCHSRLILGVEANMLPIPCRCWLEMISWSDYEKAKNNRSRIIRHGLEKQCEWLLAR